MDVEFVFVELMLSMKKIVFILIAGSLLLCAPQVSRAARVTLVNPGLTPSHPLYSLDLATDWMQLNVLTVREDRKASQHLRIAEERLAEMKKLQDAQEELENVSSEDGEDRDSSSR